MPKFHVGQPFTLLRDDYSERHFAKGHHVLAADDPDIEHFYFKAKAVEVSPPDEPKSPPSIVPPELQPAPTGAEIEALREREIVQEAREIARAAAEGATQSSDDEPEDEPGQEDDSSDLLDASQGEPGEAPARRRRRAK